MSPAPAPPWPSPMAEFAGQVAFVTGGASGIGQALVTALHDAGATVAVADISGTPPVDVSDAAQVEAALAGVVAAHGRLDMVFSNAGVLVAGPAEQLAIADFDRTIAVNLRGAFLVARFAIPHLRRGGGGSIVFTASTSALVGAAGESAYAASKAGIAGLARALAAEVAADGIRVNVAAPGWVNTPFNDPVWNLAPVRAEAERAMLATVAQRRQAHPREIAATMLFLASRNASYVTGQVLAVDGGLTSTR